MKPIKILVLVDRLEDLGLIKRALDNELKYECLHVDGQEDYIDALHTYRPDVILSDHSMAEFNSLQALEAFKASKLPAAFIIVTGAVSEEFAVDCLKRGVDDYVLKSNLIRLPTAVKSAMNQRHQIEQREAAERELLKKNEALLNVNKELDKFVYSVSHDLRAPLNSILGLIQLIRVENAAALPLLGDYFLKMEKSIRRLDETINEILTYSRNARKDAESEKIDIHAMVTAISEKLLKQYAHPPVKIEVHAEGRDFYCDPFRMSIILYHLLANGIVYADPNKACGHVCVNVKVHEKHAQLVVADDGIGIDVSLQPRIFDMFYRACDHSEGAGLGLFIVKEVVDKLKGTISVTSRPGAGSVFTISIPAGS